MYRMFRPRTGRKVEQTRTLSASGGAPPPVRLTGGLTAPARQKREGLRGIVPAIATASILPDNHAAPSRRRRAMSNPSPIDDRSLLLTLEESSRLVSHSHDPHQTLTNIVRLIQERFQTAVCSVYLLEPERQELVLGATVGLKPESVGRVRMGLGEGLTG